MYFLNPKLRVRLHGQNPFPESRQIGAVMDKVACAFPQLTVKDEHQEYGADEFVYEYRVFAAQIGRASCRERV